MTFTQFMDTYGMTYSVAERAQTTTFDPETVSLRKWKDFYAFAVRKGLTPNNAAEKFITKYKVDFDFELDAQEEGFSSVSEWARYHDAEKWKVSKYNPANAKDAKEEEPAQESLFAPAQRITEEDLIKYRMPNFVDDDEEEQ